MEQSAPLVQIIFNKFVSAAVHVLDRQACDSSQFRWIYNLWPFCSSISICQFMTSCQSKLFKFQAQNLLTFHWDVTSLLRLWSKRNFQSFNDSQRNHFNIKSEILVKVCRTRRTLGTWFIWFTFAFIIYDSQIFCVGKGSRLALDVFVCAMKFFS